MRTALLCLMFSLAASGQTKPAAVGPAADPLELRAGKLLAEALADKNPDVRKQAAQSLGLVTTREPYISMLKAMLDDNDVEVRIATVTSLGDLRIKSFATALEKARTTRRRRSLCLRKHWTLDDPGTQSSAGRSGRRKQDLLRVSHLAEKGHSANVPYSQNDVHVRAEDRNRRGARAGAGRRGFVDPGHSVGCRCFGRATAALLLGRDKDPDVLPALRDALSDKDSSVRAAAAHSIAVRNDPELRKDLTPLFEDKKESVRLRAAAGYLRLAYVKAQDESAKARVPLRAASSSKTLIPTGKGK